MTRMPHVFDGVLWSRIQPQAPIPSNYDTMPIPQWCIRATTTFIQISKSNLRLWRCAWSLPYYASICLIFYIKWHYYYGARTNLAISSQRANILKEVQIMRQIEHPNIVELIDFSESRQYYYIVLELCPGGELFHQIVRLTYFSENLSRHVILQVAQALDYLHETAGVVHRYA